MHLGLRDIFCFTFPSLHAGYGLAHTWWRLAAWKGEQLCRESGSKPFPPRKAPSPPLPTPAADTATRQAWGQHPAEPNGPPGRLRHRGARVEAAPRPPRPASLRSPLHLASPAAGPAPAPAPSSARPGPARRRALARLSAAPPSWPAAPLRLRQAPRTAFKCCHLKKRWAGRRRTAAGLKGGGSRHHLTALPPQPASPHPSPLGLLRSPVRLGKGCSKAEAWLD